MEEGGGEREVEEERELQCGNVEVAILVLFVPSVFQLFTIKMCILYCVLLFFVVSVEKTLCFLEAQCRKQT